MRKGLLIIGLVCVAIAVMAYFLDWAQTCKVFAMIGGVILVFVGIFQWIISSLDNTDDGKSMAIMFIMTMILHLDAGPTTTLYIPFK